MLFKLISFACLFMIASAQFQDMEAIQAHISQVAGQLLDAISSYNPTEAEQKMIHQKVANTTCPKLLTGACTSGRFLTYVNKLKLGCSAQPSPMDVCEDACYGTLVAFMQGYFGYGQYSMCNSTYVAEISHDLEHICDCPTGWECPNDVAFSAAMPCLPSCTSSAQCTGSTTCTGPNFRTMFSTCNSGVCKPPAAPAKKEVAWWLKEVEEDIDEKMLDKAMTDTTEMTDTDTQTEAPPSASPSASPHHAACTAVSFTTDPFTSLRALCSQSGGNYCGVLMATQVNTPLQQAMTAAASGDMTTATTKTQQACTALAGLGCCQNLVACTCSASSLAAVCKPLDPALFNLQCDSAHLCAAKATPALTFPEASSPPGVSASPAASSPAGVSASPAAATSPAGVSASPAAASKSPAAASKSPAAATTSGAAASKSPAAATSSAPAASEEATSGAASFVPHIFSVIILLVAALIN